MLMLGSISLGKCSKKNKDRNTQHPFLRVEKSMVAILRPRLINYGVLCYTIQSLIVNTYIGL